MKLQFVEEEFYKFIRQFEESTYILAYLERKINHMNFGEDDGRVGIFLRRIVLKTVLLNLQKSKVILLRYKLSIFC